MDRLIVGVLKSLGFLSPDGKSTERYFRFLDQTQSSAVLAEGIREAYSDLFQVNTNAQNLSGPEVVNKLKPLGQGQFSESVLDKMAMTFWWAQCVSEKIQTQAQQRMEEEDRVRWHTARGADPISFTMLPKLLNIIRNNKEHFDALIPDVEWAANVFEVIGRSRNVIMHSGQLSRRDMARLGTFIRDWAVQVYS